ncbi:MAG: HipA domain-containing protein [Thermodesulfobacteriota bacterium]|nr:HipA domain-containing protein [Thermodesulfobacteriota bacterium]
MRDKQQQHLRQLLSSRVLGSRELMQGLDVSQPTLSRLISGMSHEIVVMGKGRATCYGLPRKIHNNESRFPVYSIDSRGDAKLYGNLTALQGGQYWWESTKEGSDLFNQIPWFLQDMKLTGYSARSFAYRRSEQLQLPRKLADWSEVDTLSASCHYSEDRGGNLIIGEKSLARYFALARETTATIKLDARAWVYPQLAQKTLAGEIDPVPVGGEQPKFSTCIDDQGSPCHMLVKFSPATDSIEARRYADLLICEHLALEAIRLAGYSVARSRLVISGNQVFLCLKRFDRRGAIGRLPSISLRAVHSRIQAPCDNWIEAAKRLEKHHLISTKDAHKLCWLSLFSDLIGNTNQHFGNISLIPHHHDSYILAPLYGTRPTLYEPISGEIPLRLFTPPPIRNEVAAQLPKALNASIFFWKSAAIDERISTEFRQICYENCEILKLQNSGPKLII